MLNPNPKFLNTAVFKQVMSLKSQLREKELQAVQVVEEEKSFIASNKAAVLDAHAELHTLQKDLLDSEKKFKEQSVEIKKLSEELKKEGRCALRAVRLRIPMRILIRPRILQVKCAKSVK